MGGGLEWREGRVGGGVEWSGEGKKSGERESLETEVEVRENGGVWW